MTFEIQDAQGWVGVEADSLEGARLACVTLGREGYELPLGIVPDGCEFPVEQLTGYDFDGRPIWRTSDRVRRYDGRAAA